MVPGSSGTSSADDLTDATRGDRKDEVHAAATIPPSNVPVPVEHAVRLPGGSTADEQIYEGMTIAPKRSAERANIEASIDARVPADAPVPLEPNRRFGEYELIHEIARGGMGVVYKARQIRLNRIVAIKMILAGQFASKGDVQRFYTEAEAAANLTHPNIVAIYEVGECEGQHFFSMEYVEGVGLNTMVSKQQLAPRDAAWYVERIAAAIHYAHQHGILH